MLQHIILAAEEAVNAEASTGVIGTLGINFKLFLAQLVNFGIVLFIFWKWVVKPLGKTLSDRQERIESGLKNADLMESEKKNFDAWKADEMRKARLEAESIMKTATDTAQKSKQEILNEAQTQSQKMMQQTKAQIEVEKNTMLKEVKQEVATLVVAASEKILRAKLDSKKDSELISEAIKATK